MARLVEPYDFREDVLTPKVRLFKFDGGMCPIGPKRRRLLSQLTHFRVSNSTASRFRHGPFFRITSVLYSPLIDSIRALSCRKLPRQADTGRVDFRVSRGLDR